MENAVRGRAECLEAEHNVGAMDRWTMPLDNRAEGGESTRNSRELCIYWSESKLKLEVYRDIRDTKSWVQRVPYHQLASQFAVLCPASSSCTGAGL